MTPSPSFLQKIRTLLFIESNKIIKKGLLNNLIAITLFFLLLFALPPQLYHFWPQKIQNPHLFLLLCSFLLSNLTTPLTTLLFLPSYLGWTSALEKYRIEPNLSRPWQRQNWPKVRRQWMKTYCLNKLVISPIYLYTMLYIFDPKLIYSKETLPSSSTLLYQMIAIMFIDDLLYMVIHRIFHESKFLYKFHKVHHEFDSCFGMINEYAHPIEQVFGNLLPATISLFILKAHIFVGLFWMWYKLMMSAEGHCGYEIPWSFTRILPFVYGPSYHDFHHSKNVGNYSASLYVIEYLLGTNHIFFEQQSKKSHLPPLK